MAQYPKLRITAQSNPETLDGRSMFRATNGDGRFRVMWDVTKVKLTLSHGPLSKAEWTSVKDHYTAHRNSTFDVEFNNVVYTNMAYTSPPKVKPVGADLWDVTTELEEQ